MSVFVDTSVWYAALDRSDRSHQVAKTLLPTLTDPVISDHILVESHRLIDHRLGGEIADTFLHTVLGGAALLEPVGRPDIEHAARIRSEYADQSFSLVDCTSFSLMERLRINQVAALDIDYSIYRYGPRKDRAFQVLGGPSA